MFYVSLKSNCIHSRLCQKVTLLRPSISSALKITFVMHQLPYFNSILHLLCHVIFIYFILLFSHFGYYFNKRLLLFTASTKSRLLLVYFTCTNYSSFFTWLFTFLVHSASSLSVTLIIFYSFLKTYFSHLFLHRIDIWYESDYFSRIPRFFQAVELYKCKKTVVYTRVNSAWHI